ncbi:MAG: DUF2191 domain-containing protein [Actinomycetota bacterium]|jgi:hypothetical protein|nr:DUF2191 domain-containing protein [Actinomycetota bacterium]MDQ3343482.1 DUF2191 domain-containing protein [Actinomycetota bacterium]MDQ3529293.1 DUF2191 domain-containing protein [Actinomycetota bacterium]
MRTTLTLDADVAAQLRRLRARMDRPFKQLVNDVLRAGLANLDRPEPTTRGPYTRAVWLGRPRLPALDDVSEAMAIAEGDDYR